MRILLLFITLLIGSPSFGQDPMRTPKNPESSDPVTTVDGSRGKYHKKHKHPNGHNWARRRKHADTVKPSNGKEKKSRKEKKPSI